MSTVAWCPRIVALQIRSSGLLVRVFVSVLSSLKIFACLTLLLG